MDIMSLKHRIIEAHNKVMQHARDRYPGFNGAPEPEVYFFETGQAAGKAYGYKKVGYNLHVFAQDIERFINDTVPHEIAHIVCTYCKVDNGHGKNWKRVCRGLGGNGQRCFNGESIAIKMVRHRKRYEYRSDGGVTVRVSDVVHGRIQSGKVYTTRSGVAPLNRLTKKHFTGVVD